MPDPDPDKKKAVEHYKRYLELVGEDGDGAVKARIDQLSK